MKNKKLFWQLFPTFLILTLINIFTLLFFVGSTFKDYYYNEIFKHLEEKAYFLSMHLKSFIQENRYEDLRAEILNINKHYKNRITVIKPSGEVIADTHSSYLDMENHSERPEIKRALKSNITKEIRTSSTLDEKLLYVAVPMKHNGQIIGITRNALSIESLNKKLLSVAQKVLMWACILALILAIIMWYFSKSISYPLEEMKSQAEDFAKNGFEKKKFNPNTKTEEISSLAGSLNILGFELERLESIRKVFVSNVSHELKTPLTSMLGFIETLLEGDVKGRETRDKFLGIIKKNTNRLITIIEDLLTLSRIENENEKGQIDLFEYDIKSVIESSLLICKNKADKKRIELVFSPNKSFSCHINPALLENALVNLVDNAIKYSFDNSKVIINMAQKDNELIISVKDSGIGISEKHHDKIFSRFYSVDKSRSRELGGTGLGLSIVKHIVLSHKGKVWVESFPQEGSTFFISLSKSDPK